MLSQYQKDLSPRMLENTDQSLQLLVLSKIVEKIVAGRLSLFWRVTVCVLLLSFRIVGAWEHVMLCLHCLAVYMLL